MTEEVRRPVRLQLATKRAAEIIADILRGRIIDGEWTEGELIPPQRKLVEEFAVSGPSLREAFRILETQGLATVRRGRSGGATVHRPKLAGAADMFGMIFRSRDLTVGDLAHALRELEAVCSGIAALREDRAVTLVPMLEEINGKSADLIADPVSFANVGHEFHETVVRECGNPIVGIVIASLDAVWSADVSWPAGRSEILGNCTSTEVRCAVLGSHREITEHIRTGDRACAEQLALRHIETGHLRVVGDETNEIINHALATRKQPLPARPPAVLTRCC